MLSRVTGVLRLMAFAAFLGQGWFNDAYQLANTIPHIIYEFIAGGLLTAIFIPILVGEQQKAGRESPEAWRVANVLLGGVGAVLIVVSAVGSVLAPQIVNAMTFMGEHHHAEASREYAIFFLRVFAWQMIFYGLNAVFMAILNSHDVFAITAAAPIVNNIVVIVTLAAYNLQLIDVTGLALGTTAGPAASALVQVPWLLRLGMPIRPRLNFRDPVFKAVTGLGLPVVVVSIANFILQAVRSNLLYTVEGGFTTYTFCFILVMTPYGVFVVSIATVLFPTMARHAAACEPREYRDVFSKGVRWISFIMLPIVLATSVLATPVARVLFERGQYTYFDSIFTASFLQIYVLSMLPYSLLIFSTRAFYAIMDTVTPAWINVTGVAFNIALSIVLLNLMGIPGIALAATIGYLGTCVLTFEMLRRRVKGINGLQIIRALARMLAATALMAVVLWAGQKWSEPFSITVLQGSRSPLRPPSSAVAGNAVLISDTDSWTRFWTMMRPLDTKVPHVDFDRSSVVAVFGPRSTTTSSLQLRQATLESSGVLSLEILVHGEPADTVTGPLTDRMTRPAYLLATVRAHPSDVRAAFRPTGKPIKGKLARLLAAPDLFRLIVLSLVGTIVYLGISIVLGVGEIERVRSRWKRWTHSSESHNGNN
jgi:putative peptidoglycan lipid II flippase